MSIKAEGSTKFTFEIVASGADEARAKVEALQSALDTLKSTTKSPINIDVKLSSGAETLLKNNKNFLTQAVKAGKSLGTALTEGLEKSLDTKENKTIIGDTILEKNKKSANSAIEDYVQEKEQVRDSNQKKIEEQLIWAKSRTQEIQKAYDKFAEVKSQYDNGDETLKESLKERLSDSARNLIGQIDTSLKERGTKIWEQLSEEKAQLKGIKKSLFGHLNEEFINSDNFEGEKPSTVPTNKLLWEEDKKAIEKAKQRIIKNREAGSEIIAAENDQLFERSEAVDKQIEQAKAIQKKISKAESSEEIQGLMSSLNGISWTPETEESFQTKEKTKTRSDALVQGTNKASKAIDKFIEESQSTLDNNKKKIEAEEKWAKSKLSDFQNIIEKAGITKEQLTLTKDGRLAEGFTEEESAVLKDTIAQIDSYTSEDGTSEFDRAKATKKEIQGLRDTLARSINADEGKNIQGKDAYGQILSDSVKEEIQNLASNYRTQRLSNSGNAKPAFTKDILSEAEKTKLTNQLSSAREAKTSLAKATSTAEAKQVVESFQQNIDESQKMPFGSMDNLIETYQKHFDSLVDFSNNRDTDMATFAEELENVSTKKITDKGFEGKSGFDSALKVLKKFKELPKSQHEEFGNRLKNEGLFSLPGDVEDFSGERAFQVVKDGLEDALKAYSDFSSENISKYIKQDKEKFIADQKAFKESSGYSSVETLDNSLQSATKILDSTSSPLGDSNGKTISIEVDPPLATVINQVAELKASLESLPKKIDIALAFDSKKAESSLNRITKKLESNSQLLTDETSKKDGKASGDEDAKRAQVISTPEIQNATDQLVSATSKAKSKVTKGSDTKIQESLQVQKDLIEKSIDQFQSITKDSDIRSLKTNKVKMDTATNQAKELLALSQSYSAEEMEALNTAYPELVKNWNTQKQQATKLLNQSKIVKDNPKAENLTELLDNVSSKEIENASIQEAILKRANEIKETRPKVTEIPKQESQPIVQKETPKVVKQEAVNQEAIKQAEDLKSILTNAVSEGNQDISVKVRVDGIEEAKASLESLNTSLDALKQKASESISLNVSMSEDTKKALANQTKLTEESKQTTATSSSAQNNKSVNLISGLSESPEPSQQEVNQQVNALKNSIQTKITKALDSYASGDLNSFYKSMAEPIAEGEKPIGDYLLDTYTKIGQIKNGDLGSIISNLSISDADQLKNVSQKQLTQVQTVLKDMAKAYSNAYSDGLQNVDDTTQKAIQTHQPKFQEQYNQIFPSKDSTSSLTQPSITTSSNDASKASQTIRDYESALNSVKDKAISDVNIKLNIEPSPEQIISKFDSLKSALESLKSEDIKINFSTNVEEVLSKVESIKSKIQGIATAQKTENASKEEGTPTSKVLTQDKETEVKVKEVTPSKELTVPVTGEIKDIEAPKEQKVQVKTVETTSEEAKTTEKATPTTTGRVEFESNIEDLKAQLSSVRGHVEFESNISALQSQLSNLKVQISSGGSATNGTTVSNESGASQPIVSLDALTSVVSKNEAQVIKEIETPVKVITQPQSSQDNPTSLTSQVKENVQTAPSQIQDKVEEIVKPPFGLMEDTFKAFNKASQELPTQIPSSIQDRFKTDRASGYLDTGNFNQIQNQLDGMKEIFPKAFGSFKLKTNSNLLNAVENVAEVVAEEIPKTISPRIETKLNARTSNVPDFRTNNKLYSVPKELPSYLHGLSEPKLTREQSSYRYPLKELFNQYSPSSQSANIKEFTKAISSDTNSFRKSMLDELSTRLNSNSYMPSKEYADSFIKSVSQLNELDFLSRNGASVSETQEAQKGVFDGFTQNLKTLDKEFKVLGNAQRIDTITAEQAKERYGYDSFVTGDEQWKSVTKLITDSLQRSGKEIENLKVDSFRNGKYSAKYASQGNEERASFSLSPYTDINGQTSYAVQKTTGTIRPNTLVTKDYQKKLTTDANKRLDELQEYYGDQEKFFQSRQLKNALDGRDQALEDVLNYAGKEGMTQKQAEAYLNRVTKNRERELKGISQGLEREGYLGDVDRSFLRGETNLSGRQKYKFLEDNFKGFYTEKGQSVKNLKILEDLGDGSYLVQREGSGQKTTSKVSRVRYTDKEGLERTSFTESDISTELQPSSLRSWGSGIGQKFKLVAQYLAGMYMAQKVMGEISQGVSFIQQTDKALSNINMTMKSTPEQLNELRANAIQTGIDLKTNASSVIEATTIYANAGTDSEEILRKAKPTILLSNASGQSASTAADQIQAVENQFSDLEGNTERIVNSYESISAGIKMDFAQGIGSIADGVKNAGSIADEAGLGFEQFAAIIAKVAEVTREEGSVIGNTLKTTMARISRSKTGDPEVTGEDRSLAAKAYQEVLGIDLFDKNGNYADLSETFDLLASSWGTLSDAEKNYIAEQSAGVRGINTFKVMMENYGAIQDLATNALSNPNYYKQVQDTWANSLEGKKQEFEASKQQLWNNLLDSGTMKGLFDTGSLAVQLTSGIASSIKNAMDIPTSIVPTQEGKNTVSNLLTMGATGSLAFSTLGFFKELPKRLKGGEAGAVKSLVEEKFAPIFTAGKALGGATKEFVKFGVGGAQSFSKAVQDFSSGGFKESFKTAFKENGLTREIANDLSNIKAYNRAVSSGASAEEIASARETMTQSHSLIGRIGSWVSQNKGLATVGASVLTVGAIVSAITTAVEKTSQNRANTIEASQKKQQESDQANKTLGEFRSFVEENKDQYDKYTQGVNRATNKNISLSDSEYQDYLRLTNQIAQYAPDLVNRYDANGNAILNAGGRDINALTQALQANQKTVAQQSIDNSRDYAKAYDVVNRKQNWFDVSDSKFGKIQNRIDLLDWLGTQGLQSLKTWGMSDFASGDFAAKVSKELGEDVTAALPYLNEISSVKMQNLNADNYKQFMNDVVATRRELTNELESYTAPFAKSVLPAVVEMEKLEKGFQYKGANDQDWENLQTILSSTSSSKISKLLDQGGNEAVLKYAENWLEGFRVGGKDFSEAMNAVVDLNSRSSFKDLQFAFERYLPNLGKGFTGGNQNDIIESLQLEDFQKAYQRGTEIIEKYAKGEYRDQSSKLQQATDNISETLSRFNKVDDPITHNTDWDSYIKSNKKIAESVETLDDRWANANQTKEAQETKDKVAKGEVFGNKGHFDENIRSAVIEGFNSDSLDKRLREQQQDLSSGNKESKGINKNTEEQKQLSKETNALLQDFIANNDISTLDEFNELEGLLRQISKGDTPDFDLSRLQELWDRSDINIAQNEERLQFRAKQINDFVDQQKNLAVAKANSRSANGIMEDDFLSLISMYGSLPSFDYDKLFEGTYNGVHLNVEEMDKLHNEYKKFHTANYQKDIDDLTRKWQAKSREIAETTEGSAEYNKAVEQRYELEGQIQKARENKSRFEGLYNPVSEFLTALQTTEEGATYDTLASSKDTVKELYKDGRIGTDKFKSFAQMLTKEDLTGKGFKAYMDAYEQNIDNFNSLFTEDSTGVENGIARLKNSSLVNDKGELIGTIDEVSNALSLTNSATVAYMGKLREYGIETPFAEERDYMKNLRVSAENANESLSDLGKSFEIDIRKTNLEDIQKELDKITEAKKKVGEAELYPQQQADLDALNKVETYYKTLAGTVPKPLLDTRTEDGKTQANNRLNTFNEFSKSREMTELAPQGFDWDSTNIEYFDRHLEDIGVRIKELAKLSGSTDGIFKTTDEGYKGARDLAEQMIHQKQLLEEPVIMSYDASQLKNANTKNAVEQTQSLSEAIDNLQGKQELQKYGFEIPEKEMTTAKESVQSIWESIKKIDNGKLAASLAEKGGFAIDFDINDEKAVAKVEDLLGEEHFLEIIAKLTGDDQIRKQLDDIKNEKYTAKVKESGYSGGALNRYMHDAYDSVDDSTKTFNYRSLDQKAITGMEVSEIQVVAKFVADKGSLADITNPEEKEILLQYIQDSEGFKSLTPEEEQVIIDYKLGTLPEEQLPVLEQVVNKVLGIDETQTEPEPLIQDIQRVIDSDPSETPPQELQQLIDRILADDETVIPPDLMQQLIDRIIAQDASLIPPATQQQLVNRAIGSDPSSVPPAPVTQIVNRLVSGGAGTSVSKMADGTAHVSGTAFAEGNAKPSLWQRIKDKGVAFAQGLKGKWGAKKTETAVTGELGPELRVNSKTGRWEMLGANGAQFAQIHKGDIIFNHVCGFKIH